MRFTNERISRWIREKAVEDIFKADHFFRRCCNILSQGIISLTSSVATTLDENPWLAKNREFFFLSESYHRYIYLFSESVYVRTPTYKESCLKKKYFIYIYIYINKNV